MINLWNNSGVLPLKIVGRFFGFLMSDGFIDWLLSIAFKFFWQWRCKKFVASSRKKERGREMALMLPPVWIMVLMLHLRVVAILYVISKRASREFEPPNISDSFLHRRTPWMEGCGQVSMHLSIFPKGKPLVVHVENVRFTWIPHYDSQCGRVHWKLRAKEGRPSSIVPALSSLTLELPWAPGQGLGFNPLNLLFRQL